MNPAFQYQIFNHATSQFVQLDGGADANAALLFEILMQQYVTNHYLRAMLLGQSPADTTGQLITDILSEPSLFKLA